MATKSLFYKHSTTQSSDCWYLIAKGDGIFHVEHTWRRERSFRKAETGSSVTIASQFFAECDDEAILNALRAAITLSVFPIL